MSDEKKEEQKKEPQGCLVVTVVILTVVLVLLILICYKKVELTTLLPMLPTETTQQSQEHDIEETKPKETDPASDKLQDDIISVLDQIEDLIDEQDKKPDTTEPTTEKPKETEPATEKPETTEPTEDPEERKCLVVIDAGHQAKGNNEKEPIGPGAEEMKAKVTSGTQGVVTGVEEYELNLEVALKLQNLLERRGYQVKMVRTVHDVDLSNAQRAEIANQSGADVFIRIHANGDEKPETSGIMTICQTEDNPYNGKLYEQSKKLSQFVLDETVEATGGKKMFVWETDTMSGINWCQVPVTIVEMGYMTNPEEDQLMSTEEYQHKLAEGIANGIDRYFES